MRTLSSRHNPLVAEFRELAGRPDPNGARVLLDGLHLVQEALRAGLQFEAVVVTTGKLASRTEEAHVAELLQSRGVDVAVADDRIFDAVSPTRQPSGVAAIARRRAHAMSDITDTNALVLVAAEIQDPGNLGGMIRAAEAGGANAVIATTGSANPFSWKALRGSMGSALRLPIVTGLSLDDTLAALAARGTPSIAAVPRSGLDPDAVEWRGPRALWIGAEGQGLPTAVIRQCAQRVAIPMAEPVESLNAAVAAGVLIYAARRHRS